MFPEHTLLFQLTRSRGAWPMQGLLRVRSTRISTHTLTWSVTMIVKENHYQKKNFNSHAHVERDRKQMLKGWDLWHFNSHAHVERDESFLQCRACWGYFNSHAHVERDVVFDEIADFFDNFNSHAHVERDVGRWKWEVDTYISTHTLTWSVTREGIDYVFCWQFQLTRSRGAWQFS